MLADEFEAVRGRRGWAVDITEAEPGKDAIEGQTMAVPVREISKDEVKGMNEELDRLRIEDDHDDGHQLA